MAEDTRIDKYLWAIRVFKTRSEATEACKGGKIRLNGHDVKPSRTIKTGDTISARKGPVTYTYKVIEAADKRMGAKLVPNFMQNITTPDQYEILEMNKISGFVNRAKGLGRPTKKDRRELEQFTSPDFFADGFDFDSDFDFDFDDDEEND